jgi:HEAT repeats
VTAERSRRCDKNARLGAARELITLMTAETIDNAFYKGFDITVVVTKALSAELPCEYARPAPQAARLRETIVGFRSALELRWHNSLGASARDRLAERAFSVCAHLVPILLLFGAAVRPGLQTGPWLILTSGIVVQLGIWAACRRVTSRGEETARAALCTFLLGLVCVTIAGILSDDWYLGWAQGVLLIGSLLLFGHQVLVASGAPELRRAHVLASRLSARKQWPDQLDRCRSLPEVKALRDAVQMDALPALSLLRDTRPQVRIAALSALEFRKHWRRGQAETVLDVAEREREPLVKAAALSALANVEESVLVGRLAEFLRDPDEAVRRAAGEALLWDAVGRWPRIRLLVRTALADPSGGNDGRTWLPEQALPQEALNDLAAWASEGGLVSVRAARTLSAHYDRRLSGEEDPQLVEELRRQVLSSHCASCLRIELAQVLQRRKLFDRKLYELLLDRLNPAPLRLLAAEALLENGEHAGALAALQEVARLPNREIALAIAGLLQRRMGMDFGLALNEPVPPSNSRYAAEITRRVMQWAASDAAELLSERPGLCRT